MARSDIVRTPPKSVKATVDGKQLGIHDLKPGMERQRTITTTTTPQIVITIETVTGIQDSEGSETQREWRNGGRVWPEERDGGHNDRNYRDANKRVTGTMPTASSSASSCCFADCRGKAHGCFSGGYGGPCWRCEYGNTAAPAETIRRRGAKSGSSVWKYCC